MPLGVIGQKCWVRQDADFAKTVRRRQMPIDAKEYCARLYAMRPCSEIVSVEEHRALSAKAKGSVRSVEEVVLEIVKLGGYC